MSGDSDGPIAIIVCIALLAGLLWLVHYLTSENLKKNEISSRNPEVVVIDGCEYFRLPSDKQFFSLTHKGNCTNSIHYVQKLER